MEKICRAAEQLFAEKGYYNTSVVDITTAASVAPGTFYIYFEDKISVFRYLLEDLGHTLRKEIEIASAGCKTRYEKEYTGFKTFFDFVNKHRGLYKIIWEAQFVDKDLFRDYYEKIAQRYVQRIKDAQKSGEMADVDPQVLTYSFIGISNFIGLKWLIFDDKPVPDEVIREMMRFIRQGAFKQQP